jgi:hypothetical protein
LTADGLNNGLGLISPVNYVFAASFEAFVGGAYIDQVAGFLDGNKRTARVDARDRFKSTSLYARFMWRHFRTRTNSFEAHNFSYGQDMSGYHIEKFKQLIKPKPYFIPCGDGLSMTRADAPPSNRRRGDGGSYRDSLVPY